MTNHDEIRRANIPTIIVFLKGGELVDKQVGAASKAAPRGEDRKTA